MTREKGGNPFVQEGGEITRLVLTDSVHWKITNSTVMSFATKVSRLKEDYDLLQKYSTERLTKSFEFFLELNEKKSIPVISSVPGYSTHGETYWLSPLTNWNNI